MMKTTRVGMAAQSTILLRSTISARMSLLSATCIVGLMAIRERHTRSVTMEIQITGTAVIRDARWKMDTHAPRMKERTVSALSLQRNALPAHMKTEKIA